MKLHRHATRVISLGLVALGLAIVVRTAQLGGGAVGFLLGGLFLLAGAGRLYLSR